jgi:lipoprotein-anchoring transpeptidase ErfK/SrfK
MDRRAFVWGVTAFLFGGTAAAKASELPELFGGVLNAQEDWAFRQSQRHKQQRTVGKKQSKHATSKTTKDKIRAAKRHGYAGRTYVDFRTREKPGTIVIKTYERALYYVLGSGKAIRYGVAVGKEGFTWAGIARIGIKKEWPDWKPPPEMIDRKPELAEWADGMPGGIPENPLGARAMYLFRGRQDTQFRIHGTNAPSSIGTAASSGCIRMLNDEVIELYSKVHLGTKVIVL